MVEQSLARGVYTDREDPIAGGPGCAGRPLGLGHGMCPDKTTRADEANQLVARVYKTLPRRLLAGGTAA